MSGMVSFQPGWRLVQHNVGRGFVFLGFVLWAMLLCTMLAISFSGSVHAQSDKAKEQQPSTNERTWAFNFKETDIQELVRYVAKNLDKTIIINPKVKGKVQVITSKAVNAEEMYELFLSILEVHGFSAVESGDVLRIVPSKNARTSPVPVETGTSREAGASIITQVIQLENISAAKLIPVLRPLAPQQAHMAAYAASNAIIITDTAANIARIKSIIQKIDLSAVQKTEVIALEHASSEEIVRMLEQLKKNEAAKGKAETKKVVIVADKRTNSVLISGDELERQRVKTLIKHLDTPLAQSGNVRVVYLKYAKAKDLSDVLTKVVQNMERMSSRNDKTKSAGKSTSTIEADEGTNSLIITAEADTMQSLSGVIERLDIRRAQVLVEAIIVEMFDTNDRELGVEWLFLDRNGGYGSSGTGSAGLNSGIATSIGDVDDDGNAVDARAGIGGAIAGTVGQVLGVGRVGSDLNFNVVINALQRDEESNILSTPSLMTLDNEEASIVVGDNITFVTGSYTATGAGSSTPGNPFQTQEQKSVGVTLKITPHINEGRSLILEIDQEVSSVKGVPAVNSNPTTTERKINTKVLVDDGQTIVLGGLIDDQISEVDQKVPFFGSIPLVGALFRSSGTRVLKKHLLIFIRATIIRDKHKMDVVTGEKYKFIREEQRERIENGVDLIDDDWLPLLPEWQEQINELERMKENDQGKESEQQQEINEAAEAVE
jgi:general secretion pathway protein D